MRLEKRFLKTNSLLLVTILTNNLKIFFSRTFTFGVGTPIQNGVSPAIVLASTAMLGILLVVLITSGIVCIVKKLKKRVDEQQQQPNYRPI